MALTSKVIKRVDLAHEPGSWVEARMPSLAILDRARQARLQGVLALMAELDLSKLKDLPGAEAQQQAGSEYDWQTMLAACVVAWSYPEPVSAANVAELDEATVKAVMAALLPAESEAERKNA